MDDLGPQEAERVRERREREAGPQLLGDGRAPDEVTLLEDERAHTGLGKVSGSSQAVVAAADDDGVPVAASTAVHLGVVHGLAAFRSGLKKGNGAVCARTVSVAWRIVVSMCTVVPGSARSGRTRAIPMCRWRAGEYMKLVA